MLRTAIALASRCLVKPNIQPLLSSAPTAVRQFWAVTQPFGVVNRQFSAISRLQPLLREQCLLPASKQRLTANKPSVIVQQTRSVTKYSIQSGKRKTVKAVIKTFYRLHWGIWIRGKAGRHKRIWRKSCARLRRLQNHVFCNATQSTMLDKMVAPFWRRPKYWVDTPYEPYHEREEFHMTRKRPLPAHNPTKN